MAFLLLRLGHHCSPDEPADLLSTGEADLSRGPSLDHGTEQQQRAGEQRGGRRVSQHDSLQKGKLLFLDRTHECVCVCVCESQTLLMTWCSSTMAEPS